MLFSQNYIFSKTNKIMEAISIELMGHTISVYKALTRAWAKSKMD